MAYVPASLDIASGPLGAGLDTAVGEAGREEAAAEAPTGAAQLLHAHESNALLSNSTVLVHSPPAAAYGDLAAASLTGTTAAFSHSPAAAGPPCAVGGASPYSAAAAAAAATARGAAASPHAFETVKAGKDGIAGVDWSSPLASGASAGAAVLPAASLLTIYAYTDELQRLLYGSNARVASSVRAAALRSDTVASVQQPQLKQQHAQRSVCRAQHAMQEGSFSSSSDAASAARPRCSTSLLHCSSIVVLNRWTLYHDATTRMQASCSSSSSNRNTVSNTSPQKQPWRSQAAAGCPSSPAVSHAVVGYPAGGCAAAPPCPAGGCAVGGAARPAGEDVLQQAAVASLEPAVRQLDAPSSSDGVSRTAALSCRGTLRSSAALPAFSTSRSFPLGIIMQQLDSLCPAALLLLASRLKQRLPAALHAVLHESDSPLPLPQQQREPQELRSGGGHQAEHYFKQQQQQQQHLQYQQQQYHHQPQQHYQQQHAQQHQQHYQQQQQQYHNQEKGQQVQYPRLQHCYKQQQQHSPHQHAHHVQQHFSYQQKQSSQHEQQQHHYYHHSHYNLQEQRVRGQPPPPHSQQQEGEPAGEQQQQQRLHHLCPESPALHAQDVCTPHADQQPQRLPHQQQRLPQLQQMQQQQQVQQQQLQQQQLQQQQLQQQQLQQQQLQQQQQQHQQQQLQRLQQQQQQKHHADSTGGNVEAVSPTGVEACSPAGGPSSRGSGSAASYCHQTHTVSPAAGAGAVDNAHVGQDSSFGVSPSAPASLAATAAAGDAVGDTGDDLDDALQMLEQQLNTMQLRTKLPPLPKILLRPDPSAGRVLADAAAARVQQGREHHGLSSLSLQQKGHGEEARQQHRGPQQRQQVHQQQHQGYTQPQQDRRQQQQQQPLYELEGRQQQQGFFLHQQHIQRHAKEQADQEKQQQRQLEPQLQQQGSYGSPTMWQQERRQPQQRQRLGQEQGPRQQQQTYHQEHLLGRDTERDSRPVQPYYSPQEQQQEDLKDTRMQRQQAKTATQPSQQQLLLYGVRRMSREGCAAAAAFGGETRGPAWLPGCSQHLQPSNIVSDSPDSHAVDEHSGAAASASRSSGGGSKQSSAALSAAGEGQQQQLQQQYEAQQQQMHLRSHVEQERQTPQQQSHYDQPSHDLHPPVQRQQQQHRLEEQQQQQQIVVPEGLQRGEEEEFGTAGIPQENARIIAADVGDEGLQMKLLGLPASFQSASSRRKNVSPAVAACVYGLAAGGGDSSSSGFPRTSGLGGSASGLLQQPYYSRQQQRQQQHGYPTQYMRQQQQQQGHRLQQQQQGGQERHFRLTQRDLGSSGELQAAGDAVEMSSSVKAGRFSKCEAAAAATSWSCCTAEGKQQRAGPGTAAWSLKGIEGAPKGSSCRSEMRYCCSSRTSCGCASVGDAYVRYQQYLQAKQQESAAVVAGAGSSNKREGDVSTAGGSDPIQVGERGTEVAAAEQNSSSSSTVGGREELNWLEDAAEIARRLPVSTFATPGHYDAIGNTTESSYYRTPTARFHRYAEGVLLDDAGWFEVTEESVARYTAEVLREVSAFAAACAEQQEVSRRSNSSSTRQRSCGAEAASSGNRTESSSCVSNSSSRSGSERHGGSACSRSRLLDFSGDSSPSSNTSSGWKQKCSSSTTGNSSTARTSTSTKGHSSRMSNPAEPCNSSPAATTNDSSSHIRSSSGTSPSSSSAKREDSSEEGSHCSRVEADETAAAEAVDTSDSASSNTGGRLQQDAVAVATESVGNVTAEWSLQQEGQRRERMNSQGCKSKRHPCTSKARSSRAGSRSEAAEVCEGTEELLSFFSAGGAGQRSASSPLCVSRGSAADTTAPVPLAAAAAAEALLAAAAADAPAPPASPPSLLPPSPVFSAAAAAAPSDDTSAAGGGTSAGAVSLHAASPLVAMDCCCGVGGNVIQFASSFDACIGVDCDFLKIALCSHNSSIYNLREKVYLYLDTLQQWLQKRQIARYAALVDRQKSLTPTVAAATTAPAAAAAAGTAGGTAVALKAGERSAAGVDAEGARTEEGGGNPVGGAAHGAEDVTPAALEACGAAAAAPFTPAAGRVRQTETSELSISPQTALQQDDAQQQQHQQKQKHKRREKRRHQQQDRQQQQQMQKKKEEEAETKDETAFSAGLQDEYQLGGHASERSLQRRSADAEERNNESFSGNTGNVRLPSCTEKHVRCWCCREFSSVTCWECRLRRKKRDIIRGEAAAAAAAAIPHDAASVCTPQEAAASAAEGASVAKVRTHAETPETRLPRAGGRSLLSTAAAAGRTECEASETEGTVAAAAAEEAGRNPPSFTVTMATTAPSSPSTAAIGATSHRRFTQEEMLVADIAWAFMSPPWGGPSYTGRRSPEEELYSIASADPGSPRLRDAAATAADTERVANASLQGEASSAAGLAGATVKETVIVAAAEEIDLNTRGVAGDKRAARSDRGRPTAEVAASNAAGESEIPRAGAAASTADFMDLPSSIPSLVKAAARISRNVCLFLPRSTNVHELAVLAASLGFPLLEVESLCVRSRTPAAGTPQTHARQQQRSVLHNNKKAAAAFLGPLYRKALLVYLIRDVGPWLVVRGFPCHAAVLESASSSFSPSSCGSAAADAAGVAAARGSCSRSSSTEAGRGGGQRSAFEPVSHVFPRRDNAHLPAYSCWELRLSCELQQPLHQGQQQEQYETAAGAVAAKGGSTTEASRGGSLQQPLEETLSCIDQQRQQHAEAPTTPTAEKDVRVSTSCATVRDDAPMAGAAKAVEALWEAVISAVEKMLVCEPRVSSECKADVVEDAVQLKAGALLEPPASTSGGGFRDRGVMCTAEAVPAGHRRGTASTGAAEAVAGERAGAAAEAGTEHKLAMDAGTAAARPERRQIDADRAARGDTAWEAFGDLLATEMMLQQHREAGSSEEGREKKYWFDPQRATTAKEAQDTEKEDAGSGSCHRRTWKREDVIHMLRRNVISVEQVLAAAACIEEKKWAGLVQC